MNITVEYLDDLIQELERKLMLCPEGTITASRSGGKDRIYINKKYVKQGKDQMIKEYAQKRYDTKLLKAATDMRKKMINERAVYTLNDVGLVFDQLNPCLQKYVTPYEISDNLYAECWGNEEYFGNTYADENLIFETDKGHKVRSKSEALIANKLYSLGIPYRYEYPLFLPNGKTVFPDFMVLKKNTREEFIIEHFGMIESFDYRSNMFKKIEQYSYLGFIQGKNLIFFQEDSRNPLNLQLVGLTLKGVFL